MTKPQSSLARLRSRSAFGTIILIVGLQCVPHSTTTQAQKHELPRIDFDGSESAHHRLHEAIHAAHLLMEIGATHEAVTVLRAIAEQVGDYEPGEHAAQVLKEWGLSPSEITEGSIDRITEKLRERRRQQHSWESTAIHIRNLIHMKRYQPLAKALTTLTGSRNHQGREELHEILERAGIPLELLERPLPEKELAERLRDSLTRRDHHRQARLIAIIDPHASELARLLLHQIHPIEWGHRDHDEEEHPLFRREHDDEDARELPPITEIIPELIRRANQWSQDCPPLARFLVSLIKHADTDRTFAQSYQGIEEQLNARTEDAIVPRTPTRNDPGAELFEPSQVRHYRISLTDEAAEQLREEPKHYVRGTFHEGDQSYPDVGIRLKGSWGSFRELHGNNKTAFTIKFNQFVKGQRFHGLRRIILNNAVQDPSYLREAIGYSLFRDAGIPAPRISYAMLQVNGAARGLYVQVEAVTNDFLSRWYDQTHGNLYEGPGDVVEWRELDLDSNQGREDRTDLRRLARALEKADDLDPWQHLSQYVDREAFARFIAMEQLVWHWDGYTQVNNYRIYLNPQTAKFEFFPHGGDQLFEEVGGSILRPQGGILGRALLQTESGRSTYLRVMTTLLDTVWNEAEIIERIDKLYSLIRPHLQTEMNHGHHLVEFEHTVRRVLQFVTMRRYAVLRELRPHASAGSWREGRGGGHSFFYEGFDDWD